MGKEITHIDYDGLLTIFCTKDDMRPSMQKPATIGDKTYATDAHSLISIPNNLLQREYPSYEKYPDVKSVFSQIIHCDIETYKDTDLFKVLQKFPKEFAEKECNKCDGSGTCEHCGEDCRRCKATGYVEDRSLPVEYAQNGTIQIKDQYFYPDQVGRLEKVVVETMVEEFYIIGRFNMGAMFKVGEIELIICMCLRNGRGEDELPNSILYSK